MTTQDAPARQVPLPSPASGSTGTAADDLFLVEFSEDQLAAMFGERYVGDTRYVDRWGRWMIFDGQVWREDVTRFSFSRARAICREMASKANEPKDRKGLTARKTISAVEGIARSDRRLVAISDQWDRDLLALNTEIGVNDLASGDCEQHADDTTAERYMTKMTTVAPDPKCSIERWLAFLDRVTNHDVELQAYLQRVCGYCLTGATSEHALFFLYGTGANGKSTFVNVLSGIMGDYHRAAPMETFLATTSDRHPTDLAGLRGARLVTATETQEGRRWDEAKLKNLTGGDKLTARFMRQDFFDFVPQFKLLISGNHKPSLRSVDEAIRRRFHLVPFTVTIPLEDRDPELGAKLHDEWPGILQWAIEGCLVWREKGLAPPAAVVHATDAYLHAEDATRAWIEDCGTKDSNAWESSADLWVSWETWAKRSGEYVGNRKHFAQAIERHDLVAAKSTDQKQRGYRGLRLTRVAE